MTASHAPQIEIDSYKASMNDFAVSYKNPFYNALLTYTEILPVGLIIALLCAFFLKKKK